MVPSFLSELRSRDIKVWAEGDRLRCDAPAGVLTPELREQLQQRKNEILQFLHSAETLVQQQRAIVPLQPHGDRVPVFGVGGHNGDVFCYRALAQHLGPDQPFFGLQPPGLDGHSKPLVRVEDHAAYFMAQIRAFRPDGPYIIAGFCAGGAIAFELARQLLKEGAAIGFVALFGCPYPTAYRRVPQLQQRLAYELDRVSNHARAFASLSAGERRHYLREKMRQRAARLDTERSRASDPVLALRRGVERATLVAARRYTPRHFAGRVGLFLPNRKWANSYDIPLRWQSVAQSTEQYFGPDDCNGDLMLREPYAPAFAEFFARCRDRSVIGDAS
jgi:thioesterase domain-containing protein